MGIPPEDAGRPTLPCLVEHFCNEMWRTLVNVDGSSDINEAAIDEFFAMADSDESGCISLENLIDALEARLESGASRVVAQQMLALATAADTQSVSKEVSREG